MRILQNLIVATVAIGSLSPSLIGKGQQGDRNDPSGHLRITLLGTGSGPTVNLKRFGPSTLVEAGTERLLFDCGRGTTLRLTEHGTPLGSVTTLFLTHLHSDHIVGVSDLFLSPWGSGGRRVPF